MNKMRTDDELINEFKLGNAACFEELVYRYKNVLYQYIMVMVGDEGAAGDLFQEVFISLFKQVNHYRPEGKLKAWLFRSARNRVLNFFRDEDRLYSLDVTDEDGNNLFEQHLPDGQPLALERLENAELGQRIKSASLALPPRQREVVYLRQYFSFKEIARMLDRPLGTVLSDFNRGSKKMQVSLLNSEVHL